MGLVKAGIGSVGGTLADQWEEFFYCDSLDAETLVTKGSKRTSANGRCSNMHGEQNVISNGSAIAVNDGQCALIVENGAVVEVCAEPGQFVYETALQPSILCGSLGEGIKKSFNEIGRRFTYGGDAGIDQRIYFFNTKEIVGNKYGTTAPIPFRVVDQNIALDMDISLRCNGKYSYKIVNPLLFYKNVCGNIEADYERDAISDQLRSELLTALQPSLAKLSAKGIRYSAIPGFADELAGYLNDELSNTWRNLRGIEIVSFGINSIKAPDEDETTIKELQKAAVMRDSSMAAASIVSAQSDAMRTAAGNENGAVNAFMGMGMAGMAGGMNASGLGETARGGAGGQANAYNQAADGGFYAGAKELGQWVCQCGQENLGMFCQHCGAPKPASETWTCSCGQENSGNFCQHCGTQRQ